MRVSAVIKKLSFSIIAVTLLLILMVAVLWMRAWNPLDVEAATLVCADDTPAWMAEKPLSVLSYNVQYMASKEYIFFYDIDPGDDARISALQASGKTLADKPAKNQIYKTLNEVAEIILSENPDVVMLQEVSGPQDSRVHYIDQIQELVDRVSRQPTGARYGCYSHTPYWKAEFIMHPSILGPVNMRLMTLSKYRIQEATRHQLPRQDNNFLERPFYFQRALLETRIATVDEREVALINTHFDAWGAGTGVMKKQIDKSLQILATLDRSGIPWVFGGDLNLLPPDGGRQRVQIAAKNAGAYEGSTALQALYDKYRGVPAIDDLKGENARAWFTHFPNDPLISSPDRTIDYLFYSDQWSPENTFVRQGHTWKVSDHLPVGGTFTLSQTSRND